MEPLEERRQRRKDELRRFIRESADPAATEAQLRRFFRGMVTQWQKKTGAKRVPWQESVYAPNKPGEPERLRRRAFVVEADDLWGDLPPLVRRQPLERVDSLVQKIIGEWKKNPQVVMQLLRDVQGEYFKQGMPVNYEDLRGIAVYYMEQANRKTGTDRVPEIKTVNKVARPDLNRAQRRTLASAVRHAPRAGGRI